MRYISSLSRTAFSIRYCSVTSEKTKTTPTIRPASPRMGAALSAIWYSCPSRASNTVWLASPTTSPRSMTNWTGLSTVLRLSALTIRNTSGSGCPSASASGHPVRRSAVGFMRVTRPWASVAMTPSPMEFSVVFKSSRLSRRLAVFALTRRRSERVHNQAIRLEHSTAPNAAPTIWRFRSRRSFRVGAIHFSRRRSRVPSAMITDNPSLSTASSS